MNINFDVLISGCNTRCKHCYVGGGPGALMPVGTALRCLEKLDELASLLDGEVSFTLDNEPMNHPDIARIVRAAANMKHAVYYHHGMTTGLALMKRADRDGVMRAYLESGYCDFGITVHGNAAHHDDIVRRPGAYRASVDAAAYMKACGADLNISLMFNRFFAEDADEIDALLERLQPSFVYFAVPNYTPHARMDDFEPYRAALETLYAVLPRLSRRLRNGEELVSEAERCTVGAVKLALKRELSLTELFYRPQEELYLTVHPNGSLFVGNTGAETERLGDLTALDAEKTAAYIRSLPGNRDYGAFYDVERLPSQAELIAALDALGQDLIYADEAGVIYRGLSALGVPTKILRPAASAGTAF